MYPIFADIFKISNYPKQIEVFNLPLVDVIGAFSFLIILVTLYASLRAAKESARANMLSSLPLLTLSYERDEVIVENSGNGVAANVKVDSFYNWWADKDFKLYGLTKLVFKKIPILKHGEKAVLEKTIKGVTDPLRLTTFIMFSKNQKPLIFAIKFSDLSGKRYITKVRIYKSKVEIVSSPKGLGFINQIKLTSMRFTEKCTMVWYFIKTKNRKFKDEHDSKKAGISSK